MRLPSTHSKTTRASDDPAPLPPRADGSARVDTHPTTSLARNAEGGARRGKGVAAIDLMVVLALCVIFVFGVVRPFFVEPFFIPSESMAPTLNPGDRVLAAKSVYFFAEPARGDLAVFDDGSGAVIKRVVGLAGDVISVEDGVLVVNGEPRREPYVDYRLADSSFFGPVTVPEGHVFVMGDNRSNSRDSRTLGPVSEGDLIGRAVLRFWPLERAGSL